MFSMREFVKGGFLKAVGKMADYQIILNAAAWHEKGVLTEGDLAELQRLIQVGENEHNTADETFDLSKTAS